MRPFYRHSVWVDVIGVILFGAVLLGGAGYLLYHAGGAASGLGGGGAVSTSGGEESAPARRGPSHSARHPAPSSRSNPLFGGGRATVQSGSEVEAPFSEGWQKQATPDLTGPSRGVSSAPSGGGASVGEAPGPSGPAIASRSPSSSVGGGASRTERGPSGSGWRPQARRFSGQARALSNQLGQMARASSRENESSSSEKKRPNAASGGRSSASASSDPGTPSDPNQVPIGGLEWLAAAGVLYALRRLGLRSET